MNQDVPCHRGMHIRSSMDQWVMVARDLTNLVWCIWLFSVYRHWVQCRVSKIGAPRLLFRLQCGKPNKPTMTDALNRPQAICGHDLATLRWWVSHIGFCILTILRLAVVPCRPLSSPDPRGGRTVCHCWRDGVATARRKSRTAESRAPTVG